MANRPRLVGGGGGGITRGCVLGAFFELFLLFLLASRPFRPGHFFWSICSSSSSDSESTWVIINYLGWIEDRFTDSVSESEISTGFSDGPTSSTKRNWSISSSKDSWEDAIFSAVATGALRGTCCKGIISRGGICWTGSLTGGRSSRAKKFGLDMSMRFTKDLLPWWRGLSLERLLKWVQNQKSSGRHAIGDPRSWKFLIEVCNSGLLCWYGWAEE